MYMDAEVDNIMLQIDQSTKQVISEKLPKTIRMATYKAVYQLNSSTTSYCNHISIRGLRGVGKTTMLKQLAQYYHNKGFKIAYIDGSEIKENYYYIFRRFRKLNYTHVFIDNADNIEEQGLPNRFDVSVRNNLNYFKVIIAGNSLPGMYHMKGSIGRGSLITLPELTYYESILFNKYPEMNLDESPYRVLIDYKEIENMSSIFHLLNYIFMSSKIAPTEQISQANFDTCNLNITRYKGDDKVQQYFNYDLSEIDKILKLSQIYLKYTYGSTNKYTHIVNNKALICEMEEYIISKQSSYLESLLTLDELNLLSSLTIDKFNSACKFLFNHNLMYLLPSQNYNSHNVPGVDGNFRTIIPGTKVILTSLIRNLFKDITNIELTDPLLLLDGKHIQILETFTEMLILNKLSHYYQLDELKGNKTLNYDGIELSIIDTMPVRIGIEAKPLNLIDKSHIKKFEKNDANHIILKFITSLDYTGRSRYYNTTIVRLDVLVLFLESLQLLEPGISCDLRLIMIRFFNSILNFQ